MPARFSVFYAALAALLGLAGCSGGRAAQEDPVERPRVTHIAWTELPAELRPHTFAAAADVVLVGGILHGGLERGGASRDREPAVLQLRVQDGPAVVGDYWQLPDELPQSPNVEPMDWREGGAARVSAAPVDGRVWSTVMIELDESSGCLGGWFHPVGSADWEYVGGAAPDADLEVSRRVGIGRDLLASAESGDEALFLVSRAGRQEDVRWPGYVNGPSYWRPHTHPLPDGLKTDDDGPPVEASPSGRWVAVRVVNEPRMRDGVLLYERSGAGWRLAQRIDYPGYRVSDVAVTDDWLVILEHEGDASRLRWRPVGGEEDDHLELQIPSVGLHVLGERALVTQGGRAFVLDLRRGVLTHHIEGVPPTGQWTLDGGRLVPGHAVFVTERRVGVAPIE